MSVLRGNVMAKDSGAQGHGSGHHSGHHIIAFDTLVKVFFGLVGLTVVTVLAAQINFGFLNAVVAIGIATLKAYLVCAFFMGLKYDHKLNVVIFLAGFFFLLVMYFFSKIDYLTRLPQGSVL